MIKCLKSGSLLSVVIILSITLAIRIFYNISQPDKEALSFGDAADYDNSAMMLLREHKLPLISSLPFFRAPFYSFFLYLLYLFSPQNYLLVKVIQSVLITIAALFLYKIAESFFSISVSIICMVIFLLHPYFFKITSHLQNESLFLFLMLAALYLLLRFVITNKCIWLVLCGFFSGISILTRPTAIIFTLISLVWLFILKKGLNFFIKPALLLIFSCGLIILPWAIRNYLLFNEFIYCNDAGGFAFFVSNSQVNYDRLTTKDTKEFQYLNYRGVMKLVDNQISKFNKEADFYKLTPKAREKLWYRAAFNHIKNNKLQALKLLFLNAREYMRPFLHPLCYEKNYVLISFLINVPIFLLGIPGLLLAYKQKDLKAITIFFILYFSMAIIVHAIYYGATRYRIVFIDIYLYIYASYALVRLIHRIQRLV